MTWRGLSSSGGFEMPSNAVLAFQGLKAYIRRSRKICTPSLHVASIRFPVSLKPAKPSINSRTAGAVSETEALMRSTTIGLLCEGGPETKTVGGHTRAKPLVGLCGFREGNRPSCRFVWPARGMAGHSRDIWLVTQHHLNRRSCFPSNQPVRSWGKDNKSAMEYKSRASGLMGGFQRAPKPEGCPRQTKCLRVLGCEGRASRLVLRGGRA